MNCSCLQKLHFVLLKCIIFGNVWLINWSPARKQSRITWESLSITTYDSYPIIHTHSRFASLIETLLVSFKILCSVSEQEDANLPQTILKDELLDHLGIHKTDLVFNKILLSFLEIPQVVYLTKKCMCTSSGLWGKEMLPPYQRTPRGND